MIQECLIYWKLVWLCYQIPNESILVPQMERKPLSVRENRDEPEIKRNDRGKGSVATKKTKVRVSISQKFLFGFGKNFKYCEMQK